MSDETEDLQRQIVELEAVLRQPLPDSARQMLEDKLRVLRSQFPAHPDTGDTVAGDKVGRDKIVDPQGTVTVDGTLYGSTVGLNLGTIIYGRDPQEDERRRLVWYLDLLAARLYRLPLRGLNERLDQAQGLALPHIYVMLATTKLVEVARGTADAIGHYFEDNDLRKSLKPDYNPNDTLPPDAIVDKVIITPDSKQS